MDSLKDTLFQEGVEEQVLVNQRHLIDKLLQNSNDAGATKAQIRFKTQEFPNKNALFFQKKTKRSIVEIEYSNNGRPFSEPDWLRLKKIAEGNPDEQKIGFFGVGFYSLFSVCEEPIISSGEQCMGFFWKGDMLYTKRSPFPVEKQSEWTRFYLSLREPMDIPEIDDFGKFLTTSLGFTHFLQQVSVFYDDHNVILLDKKLSKSNVAEIQSARSFTSPNKIFTLAEFSYSQVHFDENICKIDSDMTKIDSGATNTLFAKTYNFKLSVRAPEKLCKDMERVTKKRPPKETNIQIMWSSYDEYSATTSLKDSVVFQDFILAPGQTGKIFIGFPTHQTTGCNMHVAAHFIPTVERENIDFVDPTLAIWNQEMLSMVGLASRLIYDTEVTSVQSMYAEMSKPLSEEINAWLESRCIHALSSFQFDTSTPSSLVSKISASYFFRNSEPLLLYTNNGITPASQVRLLDSELYEFVKTIPTISPNLLQKCEKPIQVLVNLGQLRFASLGDIISELKNRVLPQEELIKFMKWFIPYRKNEISYFELQSLLSNARILRNGKEIAFSQIKAFANHRMLPPDAEIPETCFPVSITKHFTPQELQVFGRIPELKLSEWIQFVLADQTGTREDPIKLEQVLAITSRNFSAINEEEKAMIASFLGSIKCIPTHAGIKEPSQSYFRNDVNFEELAVVNFKNPKAVSEGFLKAIGVRDHIDLQIVFDKLGSLNWDHQQLVKFLSSVSAKLTNIERQKLMVTPIFPAQGKDTSIRFTASQLYFPSEKFADLKLDLIEWKGKLKSYTEEGKFLSSIGLRSTVPIDDLLLLCSKSQTKEKALSYLIDNFKSNYAQFYNPKAIKTPFLPCTNPQGEQTVATPLQVFWNPKAVVLGVNVLDQSLKQYADMLGVKEAPSINMILNFLNKTPPSSDSATDLFSYLSMRSTDFGSEHWRLLHTMNFIPIKKIGKDVYFSPNAVYFASGSSGLYLDQFEYIDFGVSANAFLRSCGVKDEPTPYELGIKLVSSPDYFLTSLGSVGYLALLRQIAVHYPALRNTNLRAKLKASKCLIALSVDGEKKKYLLKYPKDIYLIDDTILNQIFKPDGCPIEKLLEEMYEDLGSVWLSKQVKEEFISSPPYSETQRAVELQELIRERASLLLFDGAHERSTNDVFKDAEKRLETLLVKECVNIFIQRYFGKQKDQQSVTCCVQNGVLLISGQIDFYDIARVRLNDKFLVSTLLSTPLESLQRKGFPVDRVLSLQKSRQMEIEKIRETQRIEAEKRQREEKARLDGLLVDLQEMFPHVPRRELAGLLAQYVDSKNPIADISNHILDKRNSRSSSNRGSVDQSKDEQSTSQIFGENEVTNMIKNFGKSLGFWPSSSGGIEKGVDKPIPEQKKLPLPPTASKDPDPKESGDINKRMKDMCQSSVLTKRALEQSVKTLQSTDKSFTSTIPPEPENPVPAQTNHCHAIEENDLEHHETINGVKIFLDRSLSQQDRDTFASNRDQLFRFIRLLSQLGRVFKIPAQLIHVFYGDSRAIAFNRSRMLFFNSLYFFGLHSQQQDVKQAFVYWFMVMCHELAHNFVMEHNVDHEHYLSSYAEEYMLEFISMLQQLETF